MKGNISDISRNYAKGFVNFLVEQEIESKKGSAYELFVYSIYSIYGKPYIKKYNSLITRFGKDCIGYLKKIDGVPKRIGNLFSFEKEDIVNCSCVYALVALQYYSGKINGKSV